MALRCERFRVAKGGGWRAVAATSQIAPICHSATLGPRAHPPLEGEGRERSERGGVNLLLTPPRPSSLAALAQTVDPPPPGEGDSRLDRVSLFRPSVLQYDFVRTMRSKNREVNRLKHSIHAFRQIVIPKADDAVAFSFQPSRPFVVSRFSCIGPMLRAVDFDNQLRRHAGKVGNVGTNRNLPTKVASKHGRASQPPPEQFLCASRVGTQATRGVTTEACDGSPWFLH